MMSAIISRVSDFVCETAILIVSGCVSLLVLSGVFAVVTFITVKQLKRVSSKNLFDETDGKVRESFCKKSPIAASASSSETELGKWFVTSAKQPKTLKSFKQSITVASNSSVSSSDKDADVREFLEHLIGTLISENLDDVPLTPLSNDARYEHILAEYHTKLSTLLSALSNALHSTTNSELPNDSAKPSNLYVQLKLIINKISEKASLLPPLLEYDNDSGPLSIESRLEGQSYEDILSTAVLNKIISKCQNGKEPYNFTDEVDLNVTGDFEYRCNNNWNSSPRERLSLTVEEHIEEITTRYQSSDEETEPIVECLQKFNLSSGHRAQFPELGKDVVDVGYNSYDEDSVTEIVSNVDSWEDNWLFQKKKKNKIKTTVAQVSVPMLVPNPSEKYRALIGDVDVDETSDLSECSDSVIEDLTDFIEKSEPNIKTNYIYKYDFKSLETGSLKGKHFDDENYGDHDQDSSGVTSISRDVSDVYSFSSLSPCQSEDSLPWTGIREAKNQSIFLGQEDSGEGSLETQPENECLNGHEDEHQVLENKDENQNQEASRYDNENDNLKNNSKSLKNNDSSLTEELAKPPMPGTIAEREHLKWQQAVPLPNNPYSKENIEKRNLDNLYSRCQSTNSSLSDPLSDEHEAQDSVLRPDIKKYERDYYVNGNSTKNPESKDENGIETKYTSNGTIALNGHAKTIAEDRPKKTNLVRVSSWSDRKQSDVEIRKRLPSVRELAKQFSCQPNNQEIKKIPVVKNQMVHSLTARSMSKEFRDGLKNNIGKTFNRNIHDDKSNESQPENGKLDNAISFWENI